MTSTIASPEPARATPTLAQLIARQRPGWSLERPFYTEPALFTHDLEMIWQRQWLFAGHSAAIANPGDYFLVQIGEESIIVIRDQQGVVHALYNSCRHRGSRVCLEPAGNARSLVCPYHQWVFGQDGRLLSARLMPADFDKAQFGLHAAHARETEGVIFISLADQPEDFAPFHEIIGPRLRHHALASARVAKVDDYEIHANWKLVIENSRECYHCGVGHPQYCHAVGFAAAIGSPELRAADLANEARREAELAALGVETAPVAFADTDWFHFRRFFLREGMSTESMDGQPVAPVMGTVPGYQTGVFAVVTLPNMLLEATPDYVMSLAVYPLTPTLTRARVTYLVRGDAQEGRDYQLPTLTDFWRLTSEQDWKLCEDNQAGVNSHRYEPGPYAPDERGVNHFVQWYLSKVR